jgi:two-component system sensor histidine kinase DesK
MASLGRVTTSDQQLSDRARLGRLAGAGVWLAFLGGPLGVLLQRDGDWRKWVGLAALAAFAVIYLAGLAQVRGFALSTARIAPQWYVIALLALTGLVISGAGDQGATCLVFVSALSVATLPKWAALGMVAVLAAGITVAGAVVPGWSSHGNNLAVVLAATAVWSFRLAWQRQARLVEAERDLSELAVEEERARIARDLHDILGHSLTVISVKAELAERLFDDDPERARAELEDLQRLSRDALADVRSTAQGIRGISLPGEIASARMALESAGIEPLLPTVADEVPSRWRELFAWTLREGVTNVIRHSQASRCEVELATDRIRVIDDGRGPCPDDGSGNGLEGLRQRARLAGATVTTSPGPGDRGFSLTVSVRA